MHMDQRSASCIVAEYSHFSIAMRRGRFLGGRFAKHMREYAQARVCPTASGPGRSGATARTGRR